MPKAPLLPKLDDVEAHDSSLRWLVRSRRSRIDPHLVDLGAYNGTGRCSCKHYATRIEPLIRAGRRPEDAIEAGVLKLQPYQEGPWAGFQCYHIYRARQALVQAFIDKLVEAGAVKKDKIDR